SLPGRPGVARGARGCGAASTGTGTAPGLGRERPGGGGGGLQGGGGSGLGGRHQRPRRVRDRPADAVDACRSSLECARTLLRRALSLWPVLPFERALLRSWTAFL